MSSEGVDREGYMAYCIMIMMLPQDCSSPRSVEAPQASGSGPAGSMVLPLTLSLVTFLPALRTVSAPSLPGLRSFFEDLRPQQRHVSPAKYS